MNGPRLGRRICSACTIGRTAARSSLAGGSGASGERGSPPAGRLAGGRLSGGSARAPSGGVGGAGGGGGGGGGAATGSSGAWEVSCDSLSPWLASDSALRLRASSIAIIACDTGS